MCHCDVVILECTDIPSNTHSHTLLHTHTLNEEKSISIPNPPSLRLSFPGYVSAIWSAASTQAHIRLDTWAPCRIHDGCHGAHIATSYTCTGCCLRSTQWWGEGGRGIKGQQRGGRLRGTGKRGVGNWGVCMSICALFLCVCLCELERRRRRKKTEEETGISWSVKLRDEEWSHARQPSESHELHVRRHQKQHLMLQGKNSLKDWINVIVFKWENG